MNLYSKILFNNLLMSVDSSTLFGIVATGTAFFGLFNLISEGKRKKKKEIIKKSQMELEDSVSSFRITFNSFYKNNVIPVDHLSNIFEERKGYRNPMLIQEGEKFNRGQFLPEKSFINDGQFCVGATHYESEDQILSDKRYMKAGPSRILYFNPAEVKAAIVTCGGLCPGLNVVIR